MKTGTFKLKNHLLLSVIIILVLMVVTLIISEILIQSFKVTSQTGRLLIILGSYSVFCFLIIPALRLPRGKRSFPDYLSDIRLKSDTNIPHIIIISGICYLFFAGFQLAGSLIYYSFYPGSFVFDFSRHSLLQTGSVNAGIFEEIIFRGVILTLLLDRLSENKTILLSALAFAGIHLLNLLNPNHQGTIWILAQVTWAFALGIMYAYLVIRMNSIIPAMILHYFINALTGVWLTVPQGQTAILLLYHLAFFGIIPAGLVIIWVKYRDKQGKFKSVHITENYTNRKVPKEESNGKME